MIRQPHPSLTTAPPPFFAPGTTRTEETHLDKGGDAAPDGVVGTLFPAPLPHDDALVGAAAHQVGQQRDHDDDAEDAAGAHGPRLVRGRGRAAAEVARARLEGVHAVVRRADEGEGGVRGQRGGPVAVQRYQGGFAPFAAAGFGFRGVVVVVVVVVDYLPCL